MLNVEHGRTSYSGPIIDSHTFYKYEKDPFGQMEASPPFFDLPQFEDTSFLTIATSALLNREVLDEVLKNPRILGTYLMFNPNPDGMLEHSKEDSPREIQMLAEQPYVVGLKTLPALSKVKLDSPLHNPYWRIASQIGIPVLIHFSGSAQIHASPEMLKKVMEFNPYLKVIAAHFGGLNPSYMEKMVRLAEEKQNLYLNTTGMAQADSPLRFSPENGKSELVENEPDSMDKEILSVFFDAMGRVGDRVLFGSDLGYHPVKEYSHWPVNKLPEDLQQQVFLDNAVLLFGERMKKERKITS